MHTNTEKQRPFEFVEVCKTPEEAVRDISSNSSILVGGFGKKFLKSIYSVINNLILLGLVGVPEALIEALHKSGNKDLLIISNEGGNKHHGLDILLESKQVFLNVIVLT